MDDSRRIEQAVCFVHARLTRVHRVVVGRRHDANAHDLELVHHALRSANERTAERGLVQNRSFHVGVGDVGVAHDSRERLIPGVASAHWSPDDDVADRREGERLGDLHRELFRDVVGDRLQDRIPHCRSLPLDEHAGQNQTSDSEPRQKTPGTNGFHNRVLRHRVTPWTCPDRAESFQSPRYFGGATGTWPGNTYENSNESIPTIAIRKTLCLMVNRNRRASSCNVMPVAVTATAML